MGYPCMTLPLRMRRHQVPVVLAGIVGSGVAARRACGPSMEIHKCRRVIVLMKPTRGGATIHLSGTTGLNVTEHVTGAAQENDSVAGWITAVPFEFVDGNFNFRADIDMGPAQLFVRPIVCYDHVGLAISDMDFIGPIGVGFAAT